MRIIYIDIDSLRPDHLGCYGYHRNTSSNIDLIAKQSLRFNQCYISDSPCLPSRAALQHGRFGIHTGVINHGGAYADPLPEGPSRQFRNSPEHRKWVEVMRDCGYYCASVSSFAGRHNAWWWSAGFNEIFDCGKEGMEIASEVTDQALEMIERHINKKNFFLHFHLWDPHTPYRVPEHYGNPFEDAPIADWVTREMIDKQQQTYGPHSANATLGDPDASPTPREVSNIKTLEDYKTWIDGYDVGIRYADDHVGMMIHKLKDLDCYEETAIIVASDHGENQGELNVYGDHQTADLLTHRVCMLVKWPGITPDVNHALYYQFDITASLLELMGIDVPSAWDAKSFKDDLVEGKETGREYLVLSHGAWSCQRALIWKDHILIKTYMDGLKDLPELMLFNFKEDVHELNDLSSRHPELAAEGVRILENWVQQQLEASGIEKDPMIGVIEEGGPLHTRGRLQVYLDYYRSLGRNDLADRMERKYSGVDGY